MCVHEDWEVEDVDETCDMEEGEYGEGFVWIDIGGGVPGWSDLTDLVGLGDYVAVGYHYLALVSLCS